MMLEGPLNKARDVPPVQLSLHNCWVTHISRCLFRYHRSLRQITTTTTMNGMVTTAEPSNTPDTTGAVTSERRPWYLEYRYIILNYSSSDLSCSDLPRMSRSLNYQQSHISIKDACMSAHQTNFEDAHKQKAKK